MCVCIMKILIAFAGMWIGKFFSAALGASWYAFSLGLSLKAAVLGGVVPFLPGDLVKTVAVAAVGPILRRHLDKEGIVEYTKTNNEDLSSVKMKG